MQKWEYKTFYRSRNSNSKWSLDIEEIIACGKEGWELIAVTPRSGDLYANLPSSTTTPGYTSEELWVFKRPIED